MTENGIGIGACSGIGIVLVVAPSDTTGPRQIPQLRESGGAGALNEDRRDQPQ